MTDLQPYLRTIRSVESRRAGRELARLREQTAVTRAAIEAEADLQATKVDAVAWVGMRAMRRAQDVGELEQLIASTTPTASAQAAMIANRTTWGMADVIDDTVAQLRRI